MNRKVIVDEDSVVAGLPGSALAFVKAALAPQAAAPRGALRPAHVPAALAEACPGALELETSAYSRSKNAKMPPAESAPVAQGQLTALEVSHAALDR